MPAMPARQFHPHPHPEQLRVRQLGCPLAVALNQTFVMVEIGCGVGWHAIQYAKRHPARGVVAIERTHEKFAAFASRLSRHDLTELAPLCAVHADAVHFLDRSLAPQSVDEVFVLYPNPEPKRPSQRWFRSPFMPRLTELLKIGGRIHLATNIQSYADEAEQNARPLLNVSAKAVVTRLTHAEFAPRTHFEKKYFQRGERLHLLDFVKAGE